VELKVPAQRPKRTFDRPEFHGDRMDDHLAVLAATQSHPIVAAFLLNGQESVPGGRRAATGSNPYSL
jgi:hypothetical protein